MKSLPRLAALLALPLLPVLAVAFDVSLSAEIRLGKIAPPPPPEVVVVEETAPHGPPPWAPAHGLRRNRAYYYYPGSAVYYRPADRMWIYLDGGDWRVGLSLPSALRVDFDHSVALTMETERPYEFHDSVRAHYPADYFVTKVRVKEKGDKPAKIKTEPTPGSDHADRGGSKGEKGKGKKKDK